MTTLDVLMVLLAASVALHIGNLAAFIAWRDGTPASRALLVGGSTVGAVCGLYFAAVAAYGQ